MNSLFTKVKSQTSHLTKKNWLYANQHLVAKILRELFHEKIIQPLNCGDSYSIEIGQSHYRFQAQSYQLDHLDINPTSISRSKNGQPQVIDAIALIIELSPLLDISASMLPIYLDEISSTLYGYAFKYQNNRLTAHDLVRADYQIVETAMTEGHPVFIANNGRIGFDADDYLHYAPESANPIKLVWIAAHRNKTVFSSLSSFSYSALMEQELEKYLLTQFAQYMQTLDLDLADYYLMPLHPWQWKHRIAISFAADIANQDIVYLGEGHHDYLAQQSIRTFFNISQPQKNYVKTALSVLNMGFMRGLDPHSMVTTPSVNEWLNHLVQSDNFLQQKGFTILREHAAIGYFNPYFEIAIKNNNPHKKMLSALWRESPMTMLNSDQRLMTMASLLHLDNQGKAVVAALIEDSAITVADWISRYLDVYLSPLLHTFFAYDLVFMPHGENLMLVLENNQPVKMLMKDIGEEIAILNSDIQLPKEIDFLHVKVKDEMKINYILLDIFDCFFRYLVPLLQKHLSFAESHFWQLVAQCIYNYQSQHLEQIEKFEKFDLFQPDFVRICLNRLQMANNQQMIDLDDREKNLKFAEKLRNPLYAFRDNYAVTVQMNKTITISN
ncbi:IucA/IucC family siderophore biosynthesis protein [Arsenophonus nasoniae]|uniref:Aerobactin synthase n=1 Tax=Arsenophonus nasoniae TaxID=638 RepID=D2U2T1_9GAMM|nr:IucA/IucC family siderophore biosynthesis protein [Arsenophonus nasoniae]QBY45279.1 Aerobactin synthase [Arsenophonus nasoniae]WGM05451.1 IucA/IucC family siderophore biosynthesis protein [Arsenophonus nasoniae]WGM10462.1 IucA/IucC family siderophore biosynthesis protein [Arsenophonus nasoniae]WGM15170.1 IucA/IucC family siderophore biosynthesis protein [Arsenophonus nasoniae]CBA75437.1 siderophore biosynthesis protein [Arsenophonus nasoniae]